MTTPRSSPMCGRAGSMASMARAFIAIMTAIRQTNSANPGPLEAAAVVGERSGELPAMLRSLARLCVNAGRARMKQFLALLEPLAIMLIGSVIGVIMIGIILAITSANEIVV